MTDFSSLHKPRTVVVFDIETAPDDAAAHLAGHKGTGLRPALLQLTTACLLIAKEEPDGTWGNINLKTFSAPSDEFDILLKLDEAINDLPADNTTLVTYNGRQHDLAVLRRRAARYWMFGLPGLEKANLLDHVDLMLWQRRGRREAVPSLRDTCAGLGIGTYEATRRSAETGGRIKKCQSDVVATFILYLYEAAIARGSPDALLHGWETLSRFILDTKPRPEHLKTYAAHPLLRAAQAAESA